MIFETKRKWTVVDQSDSKTLPPKIGGDRYDCLYKLEKKAEVVVLRNCRTLPDGKIDAESGGPFAVNNALAWSKVLLAREILQVLENRCDAQVDLKTFKRFKRFKRSKYVKPLYSEEEIKKIFTDASIAGNTVVLKSIKTVNRAAPGVLVHGWVLRSTGFFDLQVGNYNVWRRLGKRDRLVIQGPGGRQEFRAPAADDKFEPGKTTIIGDDKP